ncbi:low temperature requirement protein A [Micromonospora yasonensis]|uniref:low temperature requirement protein A n=1 Tax=Micromonospora yasonensis TaxID=1128667 RepID=UPI00222EE2BF|nr:low temperature requirement protein A [Micromonospora yasonensis]MCW3840109.1 low temperature requirement protein A [Micromonospora yasonensis]
MIRSGGRPDPGRHPAPFSGQVELAAEGVGVTRLELFLDLVFVYAFFATTNLMEDRFGPEGLLEGVLVVLLLVRCWVGYLLLGNMVRLDRGIMPPVVFGVAVVVLLLGIAAPVTFIDRPGGLFGPLIFVVAFVLARLGAILILIYATRDTPRAPGPAARALLPLCGSGFLLLCGAVLPHHLPASVNGGIVRIALFLCAAVVDFSARRGLTTANWQIVSVAHWTERHRLLVLIALGETIISIGTSRGLAGGPPITWAVVVGSVLGLLIVAVLWWRYFDIAGLAAAQALERHPAATRTRFGRDAYGRWHLPLILGLVLLALGLKRALSSVEPATAHRWDTLSVLVLYGGVLLYLLGLVALERHTIRLLGRSPLLTIVLVIALVPVAVQLPVVSAVGLLAAVLTSMVLADLTVFRRRHRALHELVAPAAARAAATGVAPKELFLDLVFVYAFIQVSVLIARQPSAAGIAQGLAVLILLWVAWREHALLGNWLRSESVTARLSVLLIVALALLIGIATPQAFEYVPGGLPGPLIVVTCYVPLRVLQVVAYRRIVRRQAAPRAQALRASIPAATALVLLLGAALITPRPHGHAELAPLVAILWLAAIALELAGGYLADCRLWQVSSAKHWTERYLLIILIALGEVIISAGVGVYHRPISWPVIGALAVSMILLASLWWAYFHIDAVAGYRAVQAATGDQRAALARDAYAYLHLPMIAGLMLLAFGLHKHLELVAHPSGPADTPVGHATLFAGVIVYLVANQAFWWRIRREIRWVRIVGILLTAALVPITSPLPPPWELAMLAVTSATVTLIDSRRNADLRRQLHEPAPSTILANRGPVGPLP